MERSICLDKSYEQKIARFLLETERNRLAQVACIAFSATNATEMLSEYRDIDNQINSKNHFNQFVTLTELENNTYRAFLFIGFFYKHNGKPFTRSEILREDQLRSVLES